MNICELLLCILPLTRPGGEAAPAEGEAAARGGRASAGRAGAEAAAAAGRGSHGQ